MNKGAFAQKTHEQDVDFFKNWLCDTTPLNVRQGLEAILSYNNSFYTRINHYNQDRPHSTFDGKTPHEVYAKISLPHTKLAA